MRKLLLFTLTAIVITACYSTEDPLKYKGCVVVDKIGVIPSWGNVYLKLSPEMKEKYKEDYMWIGVPKWEWDKLNIGDTIK